MRSLVKLMKTIDKALLGTVEEMEEEISERHNLMSGMVGKFYPLVLESEILELRRKIFEENLERKYERQNRDYKRPTKCKSY